MAAIRIVDVTDTHGFGLIPSCADPGFDHRTCDYWEDADRGSKAARAAWLEAPARVAEPTRPASEVPFNPFAPPASAEPTFNPFATGGDALDDNPFAPRPKPKPSVGSDVPRKLGLLGRGLAVFGSYAKVLLVEDEPVAYAQFGPLSA